MRAHSQPRSSRRGRACPGPEVAATVLCPFCGQALEVVIETSQGSQRFATDCEVCCRPFEVIASCQAGEWLSLEAVPA